MLAINFIAKHLNKANLSKPIQECDTVCAFTGEPLKEGVKLKKATGSTFTDHEYLRYKSDYVSVNAALCITQVIKTEKGTMNSLRNYSFVCTENELKLVPREDFMNYILNPPKPPFIFAYSFNNKKHISYKAVISLSTKEFFVCTDIYGNVKFNIDVVKKLYPILQDWYSRNSDIHSKTDTYFTKSEILAGSDSLKKIQEYGFDKFYKENAIIDKYRKTSFLTILVRLLNPKEI